MLDGSVSTSPSGYLPLTYAWTQTGGPPVALSDSTSPGPTFSAPGGPAMLVFSWSSPTAWARPPRPMRW